MKTETTQTIFDAMPNEKTDDNKEIVLVDLIFKKNDVLKKASVKDALNKGKAYMVRAKNLVKSFPTLASIETLPIYRAYPSKSGLSVVLMPSIFKTEDGLKVCLPDDNASITEALKIDSIYLSLEDETYCILTDGKDCFLKCSLGINKTQLKRYVVSDGFQCGDYIVKNLSKDFINDVFRERPKLEIPLDNLEIDTPYTIIGNSGKSKKFETPLISVKDDKGKSFENVITNANLEKNGSIGRSFKIFRVESYTKKITDSKGKKKEETQKKYFIDWLDEKPLIITED